MSTTVRHRPGAKTGDWVVILSEVVVKMNSLISHSQAQARGKDRGLGGDFE
jgi:hypothetical protein